MKDDDGGFNDFRVKYADKSQGIIAAYTLRPLDPRKIDWHSKSHTRYTLEKASQIVEDANRFQREGDAPNEVMVLSPEAADRLIGNLVDRIVAKVAEANAQEIEEAKKEVGGCPTNLKT